MSRIHDPVLKVHKNDQLERYIFEIRLLYLYAQGTTHVLEEFVDHIVGEPL